MHRRSANINNDSPIPKPLKWPCAGSVPKQIKTAGICGQSDIEHILERANVKRKRRVFRHAAQARTQRLKRRRQRSQVCWVTRI